jgi:uncharacterized protein involved in tolerance to divalent cations
MKRRPSGSPGSQSPSKKGRSNSDETTASARTESSTFTKATTPDQDPQEAEKMEQDGTEDYSNYYRGFPGNPTLLARANRPRTIPPIVFDDFSLNYHPALKQVHPIGKHDIKNALENGLFDRIKGIMATMVPPKWISIDFLRIGYSDIRAENPAVILVTVEKDKVPEAEAARIVREIEAACVEMDVEDIDVEVMEGHGAVPLAGLSGRAGGLPLQPLVPYIGSSIALSNKHNDIRAGCGTLGGYVSIDGVIYGLTNHHVALGNYRDEPFPLESEKDTKLFINQPAEKDLKRNLEYLEKRIPGLEKQIGGGDESEENERRREIAQMQEKVQRLKMLQCEDKIDIGHIYRSSGIRARDESQGPKHHLDWALIKIENSNRVAAQNQIVNKVPSYSLHYTDRPEYVDDAGVCEGNSSLSVNVLPGYLKRGLTIEEIRHIQASADEKDKKYVVWKCGRTSHFTFGCANSIDSLYAWDNGKSVTQEWVVIDKDRRSAFSDYGDSGSFVWGSDGYVAGMLWGGVEERFYTLVTPIEVILEDIKAVCGAREVKLIVRPEEETDKVFEPPER